MPKIRRTLHLVDPSAEQPPPAVCWVEDWVDVGRERPPVTWAQPGEPLSSYAGWCAVAAAGRWHRARAEWRMRYPQRPALPVADPRPRWRRPRLEH